MLEIEIRGSDLSEVTEMKKRLLRANNDLSNAADCSLSTNGLPHRVTISKVSALELREVKK